MIKIMILIRNLHFMRKICTLCDKIVMLLKILNLFTKWM